MNADQATIRAAASSRLDRPVGRMVIEGTQASRERPILFSAPMVRALLDGTKTQTRRPLRDGTWLDPKEGVIRMCSVGPATTGFQNVPCPYGAPGDRLWVREAWRTDPSLDIFPPRELYPEAPIQYEAGPHADVLGGKLRPGMFMPRWACRITLVVTGVRVERLQDITRGDAMAEGCPFPNMARGEDPRVWYEDLWCDLNGADSWRDNPWVWVVEFRKTPNVNSTAHPAA